MLELWYKGQPYYKSANGMTRCYIVSRMEQEELGVNSECVTLQKSNSGEIYVAD
jgi:hypothetical protein